MPGPTVVLEFKSETGDAITGMGNLGKASKTMGDDVGGASEKMRDSGVATDEMAGKAGEAEGKFQGFADVMTGTGDIMTGFRDGDVLGMATGFADLAGGMESFLIPMFGRMGAAIMATSVAQGVLSAAQTAGTAVTGFLTAAMHGLNAAIRANPLMFIIGLVALLVGAFVVLWNKSAGFRDFFIGMWNGIKSVVGGVVEWIKNAWNGMVDWFKGLPGKIGTALAGIGTFFKNAFKGAANLAIDAVNWMIDQINKLIYGINIINPFDDIPDIPKLKRMHSGGTVQGPPGSEVMTILRAGEQVLPYGTSQAGRGGGGGRMVIMGSGGLYEAVMAGLRTGDIYLTDSAGGRVRVS